MALADLLHQDAIIPALRVNSKKQLLQELAARAARITGLSEREIFDVILQRERLGSTGVGNGIAIPHGKLVNIHSIVGIFARLEQPVDFEALDDQPVDLVFLLLAPEGAGAIISKPCRASPASCAIMTWLQNCGPPIPPRRSTPSSTRSRRRTLPEPHP